MTIEQMLDSLHTLAQQHAAIPKPQSKAKK